MTRPRAVELLVVGGGIIGLACAYEAARRGWSVLVVERERPGSGATHAAAGMIAAVAEAEAALRPLVEFSLASARRYPEFVAELEQRTGLATEYDTTGTLLVAAERDHLETLEHLAAERHRLGLDVQPLTVRELRRLEPHLGPRTAGGFASPEDRQVNPRALARALAAGLERLGGQILYPARLEALEGAQPCRARVSQQDEAVEVEAGAVLVACGSWSRDVLPELHDLPLRPVKGQTVVLEGQRLFRHVVRTPDVYIVPRHGGELVLGASSEELGFDRGVRAGPVRELFEYGWRAAPGIAELEVGELCVGFRPALRDHMPAIGATQRPGVYLATGHYRHGILLAPATAEAIVRLMHGEQAPEIAPFSPGRFARAPAAGRS